MFWIMKPKQRHACQEYNNGIDSMNASDEDIQNRCMHIMNERNEIDSMNILDEGIQNDVCIS